MICDIKSLTREELAQKMKDWGHEHYRVAQVLNWLYANRATTWDVMTNLPLKLRNKMQEDCSLHGLELVEKQGDSDTTQKFLWRLPDGAFVESVLIPANQALYSDPSDRQTLCISTQVGCAFGCKFCASGLEGFKRNLHVEEIVEQVLAVERWYRDSIAQAQAEALVAEVQTPMPRLRSVPRNIRSVDNIVVMGMGEPLANYDNLLAALRIINAPWGAGIGARKITISTSGLVPQIRKLAEEPAQYRLAISLHGATDEIRNKIMPINRKYPLSELIGACEYYQEKKGRMITLEYILIGRGERQHLANKSPGRLGATAQRQSELDSLQSGGGAFLGTAQRRCPRGISIRPGQPTGPRHAAPRKRWRHRCRLRTIAAQNRTGTGGSRRRVNPKFEAKSELAEGAHGFRLLAGSAWAQLEALSNVLPASRRQKRMETRGRTIGGTNSERSVPNYRQDAGITLGAGQCEPTCLAT